MSVRKHPLKLNTAISGESVPWCGNGIYLAERPVFTLDPAYHSGSYYVQEASSMFLDFMVRSLYANLDRLRVLDLCAAPGGKTTLLAAALGPDSLLVSNEVIRTRASILEENVIRWGYPNNWVTSNDPRDFGRLEGYFDLIVADAPCSGSGLFRKDEHALDEWSQDNVVLCSQRQQRILADVWPALKENGILLYATCSYSRQEDEMILDWIAENFPAETIETDIPEEWGIAAVISDKHRFKGYRFFPDRLRGEGFFIAAIRKKEPVHAHSLPKFRSAHDHKMAQQVSHLLDMPERFSVLKRKEDYHAILSGHEADKILLDKHLYLRTSGISLGVPTAKEWAPAHDIALSIARNGEIPSIDLNKENALKFLKKDDLPISLSRGWYIMTYNGQGLGWIKSVGNRINNYLPKHWRIRMDIPGDEWAQ